MTLWKMRYDGKEQTSELEEWGKRVLVTKSQQKRIYCFTARKFKKKRKVGKDMEEENVSKYKLKRKEK